MDEYGTAMKWVKKNECETLRPLQYEVEQMLMQKTDVYDG